MTTITLEALQAEHSKLGELIESYRDQYFNTRTIRVAAADIKLQPGEHYAGTILADDGTVSHHLVLLAGEAEDVTWTDAQAWAQQQGGELPTRAEQALLYANLKAHFKPEWYWSSQAHESEGSYAWFQDFLNGDQHFYRKSIEGRARAVRRLTA